MNRTYLNFATMRMSYVLLLLTSRGTLHQVMITYLSTALHCRKGYLNVHYNKIAMRLKMYAQCSGYSEWIYKMNIQAILLDLALVFTLSSTQNIYDGCSTDKDCLGFMKGMDDTQTTCLQTMVMHQWLCYKFRSVRLELFKFQNCTLVIAYNTTSVGYAQFEVMHTDAGWISLMTDEFFVITVTKP